MRVKNEKADGEQTMNFLQLKYAVEVARCGSINKAADKLFVEAPKVPVRGPVGAGDVMMAGIVHARQNRMDFETTACYAVAAASASVTVEGTRMAQRRDVLKLFPSISAVRI